jgi:hypothetical protein
MERFTKKMMRLLHPGMAWILLLTPLSAAALIYTFVTGRAVTPLGYISYVLSAYTMTVLIVNLQAIREKTRSFIQENKYGNRLKAFVYSNKYGNLYMTDISFRVKVSLFSSLFINLLYAAFKLIAGIHYASFWYGADAVYYIVLSAARVLLTRHVQKGERDLEKEYRVYRSCGVLLFVLNATLTGVVYQIVNQNMGYRYPGLLIYAVATYAFVYITVAIVNVVKYRKLNSPVFSAVKTLSLDKALVAMFALQSAMFASFNKQGADFERLMNSIFGGLVCLSLFAMAAMMVVEANDKLKKIRIIDSPIKY